MPGNQTMNFREFLSYLIDQWFNKQKFDFAEESLKRIDSNFYSKIDGCGISLMTLTKLNQVITSDELIPYEIDYRDDIFTSENFKETLIFYATSNFVKDENEQSREKFVPLYQEILKKWDVINQPGNRPTNSKESEFLLKDNGELLNPDSFIDLMCILLKRRVLRTVNFCQNNTK